MDRGFHLTADGLGKTRKRLQRGTMNVNLPLYKKQLPGLEEAGVNPGYARGLRAALTERRRAAKSKFRFLLKGKAFERIKSLFLLFVKDSQENSGYADKMLGRFSTLSYTITG